MLLSKCPHAFTLSRSDSIYFTIPFILLLKVVSFPKFKSGAHAQAHRIELYLRPKFVDHLPPTVIFGDIENIRCLPHSNFFALAVWSLLNWTVNGSECENYVILNFVVKHAYVTFYISFKKSSIGLIKTIFRDASIGNLIGSEKLISKGVQKLPISKHPLSSKTCQCFAEFLWICSFIRSGHFSH